MADKIGRNDPCPCGSGKKYKNCCRSAPQEESSKHPSPRFRFEPGSYGGGGGFVASLACLKQTAADKWEDYYVLVDPSQVYTKERAAVSQAKKDLEAAFAHRERSGSDLAVGEYLSRKGYKRVTD